MRKNLLTFVLALFCAIACAFGLAACNNGGNKTNDAANYLSYRLKDDDTYAAYFSDNNWTQIFVDRQKNGWTSVAFTIPAEYKGKAVTSIDRISGNDIITSLTISDSVTSIDNQAFDGFYVLESVTMGNNVKTIGQSAFANCSKLTSINIPNSVTSLGKTAFRGCRNLENVTLGNGITRIEDETFADCEKLETVTIPQSVEYLGGKVFSGTNIKNLVMPNSLTKVGNYPLEGCMKLESLTLKFPEYEITYDDTGTTETVTCNFDLLFGGNIPQSLKTLTVTSGKVLNCRSSSLQNVILYDGVRLDGDAFYHCPSLEYNEYGNGLYLGNNTNKYMFLIKAKNNDITSLRIHADTQFLCSSFRNCNKLTTIEISKLSYISDWKKASLKTEKISLKELFNLDKETATVKTIKVADGETYLPENLINFGLTELILPNTLTEIAGDAIPSERITTITYKGTKAQLRQVEFGWGWCGGISEINSGAIIHCDDGNIFVSWYGVVSGA